jgi:putative DNA primase/helicase
MVPGGFKAASSSMDKLLDWSMEWPSMNIGLATGKPSMVIVLDVDEKSDVSGAQTLKALESIESKLPSTLTQTTGGQGKHYFFKYPRNVEKVPSSVGEVGKGLDIRADGGYVILPPSSHKSGIKYQWNIWDTSIAECPSWLLQLAMKKKSLPNIDDIRKKVFEVPEGQRNKSLFEIACGLKGKYGYNEDELFETMVIYNRENCKPPLQEDELHTIVHSAATRYTSNISKQISMMLEEDDIDTLDFSYSERGNAFRYFVSNDKDMRYCYTKKRWFVYDGSRWEEHHGGEPTLRMFRMINAMKKEANDIENEEVKKRLLRWIAKTEEKRTIVSSISLAEPLMDMPLESMDKDPLDINCLNGTFNLKTMSLRPHVSSDHITFLAQVEYDEDATCPTWRKHIKKVFDNDVDTIECFQRTCGYSLTELNPEQVMFIAWGNGRNGKSTTFNTIGKILGDYMATAKAESFMKTMGDNDARNDLARLHRKRVVITTEPPSGSKLNETLIKSATGTDKIAARFLYQEFFEFVPQFKIFMHTNHRPRIPDSDEGIWRRIVMFPFNHVFDGADRDMHMDEKLIAESSGILNWMIDGYKKYNESDIPGLKQSPSMISAKAEYRNFEDTLMSYISDRCIVDPSMAVSKTDLFSDFLNWCELNGEERGNIKKFGMMIHGHFSNIKDRRTSKGREWSGIGLKNKQDVLEKIRTASKQDRI